MRWNSGHRRYSESILDNFLNNSPLPSMAWYPPRRAFNYYTFSLVHHGARLFHKSLLHPRVLGVQPFVSQKKHPNRINPKQKKKIHFLNTPLKPLLEDLFDSFCLFNVPCPSASSSPYTHLTNGKSCIWPFFSSALSKNPKYFVDQNQISHTFPYFNPNHHWHK